MSKECENCIKRKTMWCPPSCECMALDELPYHLDKTLALQKIDNLQQENKQLKDFLGLLELNIRINHDDIQINLYKKLLQIFKDLKDILGDKENE